MSSGEGAMRRAHGAMFVSASIYLAGLILHTADHVRRGIGVLTTPVQILGALGGVAGLAAVWLVYTRHPKAPIVAAIVGLQAAVGVTAVHFPHRWGVLSDPLIRSAGTGVTSFSWAVVLLEIIGALALGISGLLALRSEDAPISLGSSAT